MRKKALNVILFLAVVIAAVGMTLYVGRGAASILVYNFCFLGIMAVTYAVGMFGGMFRMNDLSRSLHEAADELKDIFQSPGKVDAGKVSSLNGIFRHSYLDDKMQAFTDTISQSQEGIGDIEDYLNEDDMDDHIHKRLLEMAPDIFTSLGILGTFVGLVWGLKNFEPTNYEAMTTGCIPDFHLWYRDVHRLQLWYEIGVFFSDIQPPEISGLFPYICYADR